MRVDRRRLAALVLVGGVVCAADARAQDYKLETAPSAVAVPLDQIKPKTVVFSDYRNDELAERNTGLIRFEDWARMRPAEKQLLNLFPAYVEPTVTVTRGGTSRRVKEKLAMYVAQARSILNKPPSAVNLSRYATLPVLEKLAPAIKHRQIAPAET